MHRTRTYRLLSKLFINGLRYRFRKLSGVSASPEALSIEVTHRCIARCIMCNIWKIPAHVAYLPAKDWLELISLPTFGHLKELDITGGEPFLKEDLPLLLKGICDLKATHLQELKSVAITTNGFLTEKVVSCTSKATHDMKEAGIELVLVLAMDGIGEIHDRIRNVKNGWKRLAATIEGLEQIRRSSGNVIIGLKTTILPLNVDELDRIAGYADEHDIFTIISPCIITANRYHNEGLEGSLRFGLEEIQKMIRFYESPRFRWSYHRRDLLDFLETGTVNKPCSAGFNYFFVRSTGDVFPCPLINTRLGNFKETPIKALMDSLPARQFRRRIGTFKECRSCTEPGLERYALPFEGFHYLRLFFTLGKKEFLACHAHMGLNKYL